MGGNMGGDMLAYLVSYILFHTFASSNMAFMAGSSSTKSSFTSASLVRYAKPSMAHFLVLVSSWGLQSHLKGREVKCV